MIDHAFFFTSLPFKKREVGNRFIEVEFFSKSKKIFVLSVVEIFFYILPCPLMYCITLLMQRNYYDFLPGENMYSIC